MQTISVEDACQVPVAEQAYAFGCPLYCLSYAHNGRRYRHLVKGAGPMAVQAYAQRKGYSNIVVGRYLGGQSL